MIDFRVDRGPFDVIGDVHGCAGELEQLLGELGYRVDWFDKRQVHVTAPRGRKVVFVGDLVDRGPRIPDALRIAMSLVANGSGYCVRGNHEHKLARYLEGRAVKVTNGLDRSLSQLESESAEFIADVVRFLASLQPYLWLDGGSLVVSHAGLRADMIGRTTRDVTQFAMFGDTTGQVDDAGLPVRRDWARQYEGEAVIVYGHSAVTEAKWKNNTICIDTGCVFGGRLTALRWPERTIIQVEAREKWFQRENWGPALRT